VRETGLVAAELREIQCCFSYLPMPEIFTTQRVTQKGGAAAAVNSFPEKKRYDP
jgi:hypothetical protein